MAITHLSLVFAKVNQKFVRYLTARGVNRVCDLFHRSFFSYFLQSLAFVLTQFAQVKKNVRLIWGFLFLVHFHFIHIQRSSDPIPALYLQRAKDWTPPSAGWQTALEQCQSQVIASRTWLCDCLEDSALGKTTPEPWRQRLPTHVWALGCPQQGHQPGPSGPSSPAHAWGTAWPRVPQCKYGWGRSAQWPSWECFGSVPRDQLRGRGMSGGPFSRAKAGEGTRLACLMHFPGPPTAPGGAAQQLWHGLQWTRVVGLAKRQEGNEHLAVSSFYGKRH